MDHSSSCPPVLLSFHNTGARHESLFLCMPSAKGGAQRHHLEDNLDICSQNTRERALGEQISE